MIINCVWEHNGNDTLLYAMDFPGAFTRGPNLQTAVEKMPAEIRSYATWAGVSLPEDISVAVSQDTNSSLQISDADSDVLFASESEPLCEAKYLELKSLALKSAADFLTLYHSIPDLEYRPYPVRRTFYGQVPGTAKEMYDHTKSVNSYYFAEIDVDADNSGNILECRRRGFELLEQVPGFLDNKIICGSYDESWSVRKVIRRFIWHDRIHAKAMYRMASHQFGTAVIENPFHFS